MSELNISPTETEVEANTEQLIVNPLAESITRFVHCLKDAEEAAIQFIPLAVESHNSKLEEAQLNFDKGEQLVSEGNTPQEQAIGAKLLSESLHRFDRIVNANVPETLEKALFLNIFSDFDAFSGDLLLSIYKKKPELFNSINRTIPLSDILKFSDFDELKK